MVTLSKCPFCEKTYGDAEEHSCDEKDSWDNTLEGQSEQLRKAMIEFTEAIRREVERSYNTLKSYLKRLNNERE